MSYRFVLVILAVSVVTYANKAGYYICESGDRIPDFYRCDHLKEHCDDGSDEEGCSGCVFYDFECGDGTCIGDFSLCDGRNDCADGSDEERCDGFKCADGNITDMGYDECNGFFECADKSDEAHCECKENHYKCGDGLCIPPHYLCDDYQDCDDGSDEKDCDYHVCANGDKARPGDITCDRIYDCKDKSDEKDCPCEEEDGLWRCSNGKCIEKKLKCNGFDSCGDNSDEIRCDRKDD